MIYKIFKAGGGYAVVAVDNGKVIGLILPGRKQAVLNEIHKKYPDAKPGSSVFLRMTTGLVKRYFNGAAVSFDRVDADISALSPFERGVLGRIRQIKHGVTRSYSWAGNGKARAAGNALAKNPVPIIIPCHRIIKTDGALGGFAFGRGWKKRLLDLEMKGKLNK